MFFELWLCPMHEILVCLNVTVPWCAYQVSLCYRDVSWLSCWTALSSSDCSTLSRSHRTPCTDRKTWLSQAFGHNRRTEKHNGATSRAVGNSLGLQFTNYCIWRSKCLCLCLCSSKCPTQTRALVRTWWKTRSSTNHLGRSFHRKAQHRLALSLLHLLPYPSHPSICSIASRIYLSLRKVMFLKPSWPLLTEFKRICTHAQMSTHSVHLDIGRCSSGEALAQTVSGKRLIAARFSFVQRQCLVCWQTASAILFATFPSCYSSQMNAHQQAFDFWGQKTRNCWNYMIVKKAIE